MASQSSKPSEPKFPPYWALRRADQSAVAGLVVFAVVSMGFWWVSHGGCRGRLVEIEKVEPKTAPFEVDLNSAEWSELVLLPNIGETLARRIVESRRTKGPFLDHADLQRVRGIGPKTLNRIRPYLRPMPPVDTVAGDTPLSEEG